MNKKLIHSITGLRFYMMTIIILSHMEFLSALSNGFIYSKHFHNAYVAVNFFFMVSGFGLAYSYKPNKEPITLYSSLNYAIKRVKKLYPLYITLLLICLPYCIYLGLLAGNSLLISIVKNIFKLTLNLCLVQSATGIAQLSTGLNSVSWFLSTLFLLYICCPLILKINEKIKKRNIYSLFIINTILLMISYYIFEFIENRTFFDSLSYTSPYLRIFYLIAGILIYDIMNIFQEKGYATNTVWEIITVLLNVVWFFFRNSFGINIHYKYFIDFILCALLILVFSFEKGKISKFLSNDFHVKLGKASMYWFLIHYPIRLFTDELFNLLTIPRNWISGIIEVVIIFMFTIIITNLILRRKK